MAVTGSRNLTAEDLQVYSAMFDMHASVVSSTGEKFMNPDDFVKAIAPDNDFYRVQKQRYQVLFQLADQSKSEWMKLYIGSKNDRANLEYDEFTQLLKGFQSERLQQEFKYYDPKGTGYISPNDLKTIMIHLARHKLSPYVIDQIPTLAKIYVTPGSPGISFANARALFNVIRQMDTVERIVSSAVEQSTDGKITKSDFMGTAARLVKFNTLTPMEVDTVFHLASGGQDLSSRLSQADFLHLFDPRWDAAAATAALNLTKEQSQQPPKALPVHLEVLKSVYNFALGSIAGAIGATFVYPIDLVKTRMQNQRAKVVGELLYKNSWDCFRKVVRNEGVAGLYSGLLPQLLGVAPEKAIKLTMNDLVRSKLKDKATGKVPLWGEILAGSVAGASQVVFTNPLEIVKIRLQVQGEAAKGVEGAPKRSALWIVRNLGLVGLYKGAGACLLRDIPFSGIYFPVYAHLKTDLFGEGKNGKKLSILELLTAGALAGMPAAYLVTPADVIKTRLQVAARKGETTYSGITDAFVKINREEGFRAFFKGGLARVFRSSPQFGVTLAAYELLHTVIPIHFDDHASKPSPAELLQQQRAAAEESRKMVAYGEFRKPYEKDPHDARIVLYGLRYIVENYINVRWTKQDIDEAKLFFETHNASLNPADKKTMVYPFPYDLFHKFIKENDGYFPVKIEALPEGSVIYPHTPVYQITAENEYSRLVTYLETILTMVWYPSTVATLSRRCKDIIDEYFEKTVDPDAYFLADSKLHDFGFRGCTSVEQSIIGGCAHLLNFVGTDTLSAAYYAQFHLNGGKPVATSIPATEHSVMTAFRNERLAMERLLELYGTGICACVMDSYDYTHALEAVLPSVEKLKLEKGGLLVLRPDSGDPVDVVLQALRAGEKVFGATLNKKGYKVLKGINVIQGDGISHKTIRLILEAMEKEKFSAVNAAFGMGAGLLQKVNRDTMSFATKLCHITYADGIQRDVMKCPKTDPNKISLPGEFIILKNPETHLPAVYPKGEYSGIEKNAMEVIYDGRKKSTKVWESFDKVRERLKREWQTASSHKTHNVITPELEAKIKRVKEAQDKWNTESA
ncbi:mitochondrial aspartate-glutamate transporter agc1 [Phlyctochytrium bullatum]|nr:mitochondrial aspartate-glutamate transporter agc1 [Phlyctochytrium bullatum]